MVRMCRCLMDLEGVREELGGPTTGCDCCCGQGLLILPGMNGQLGTVLLEHLGIDVQTKVDSEEKFHLEAVHLRYQDASNLGVVGVVVIGIVEELGSQKDGCNDHSMDIEIGQEEVVPLDETINVNQSQDEALGRTRRIFVNTVVASRSR